MRKGLVGVAFLGLVGIVGQGKGRATFWHRLGLRIGLRGWRARAPYLASIATFPAGIGLLLVIPLWLALLLIALLLLLAALLLLLRILRLVGHHDPVIVFRVLKKILLRHAIAGQARVTRELQVFLVDIPGRAANFDFGPRAVEGPVVAVAVALVIWRTPASASA